MTVFALFLPVSGAENTDRHHLRYDQLAERGCGLPRRPPVPLGDQDHQLRVSTGEEPRRATVPTPRLPTQKT